MELIVRAVDVGSGNTKFVAAAVGSDIRCTSFPSVAYLYAIGAYNQNVVGSKADFGTAKRGEQAGEQSKTEHKKSSVHAAFRELFNLHQPQSSNFDVPRRGEHLHRFCAIDSPLV